MERTIKFLISFLFIVIFAALPVHADDGLSLSTLITPQNVDFNICTRTYILPADKLFYMAIASVNANKFNIEEIQSKTGYCALAEGTAIFGFITALLIIFMG